MLLLVVDQEQDGRWWDRRERAAQREVSSAGKTHQTRHTDWIPRYVTWLLVSLSLNDLKFSALYQLTQSTSHFHQRFRRWLYAAIFNRFKVKKLSSWTYSKNSQNATYLTLRGPPVGENCPEPYIFGKLPSRGGLPSLFRHSLICHIR